MTIQFLSQRFDISIRPGGAATDESGFSLRRSTSTNSSTTVSEFGRLTRSTIQIRSGASDLFRRPSTLGDLDALHSRLMQRAERQLSELRDAFRFMTDGNQDSRSAIFPQSGNLSERHVTRMQFRDSASGSETSHTHVRLIQIRTGDNGVVVMPKPGSGRGDAPRVDRPPADKPSHDAPETSSENPSKPSQGTAPPTSESKPQTTPAPTPEPQPEPEPEPKPEPEPAPKTERAPTTAPTPSPAPEPVSESDPTSSAGSSSSGIDGAELAIVQAIDEILQRSNYGNSISKSDMAELSEIYGDFRLTDETTYRLNDYAKMVAQAFFEEPEIIAHARNWDNYSRAQREQAARDVWNVYSDILELPDTIGFDTFSMPRNANGLGIGGFYNSGTETVSINVHEAAHRNFAEMTSLILHESVHALWERELAHIPINKAAEMFRNGEITHEQFMLRANCCDPR